jgi:DNA-directed RNA polymerase specialized sigma24 family protein
LRDFRSGCVQSKVIAARDDEELRSSKRRAAGGSPALDGNAVRSLVGERKRLVRFIQSRVGDASDAERFISEAFCAALKDHGRLQRGETIIAWLGRVVRLAVVDFYRGHANDQPSQLWRDAQSGKAGEEQWGAAFRTCVRGLLGTIRPRYAELISRLDLAGERKAAVARELKITVSTADVVLHRARHMFRRRLLVLCASTTREACLAAARRVNRA